MYGRRVKKRDNNLICCINANDPKDKRYFTSMGRMSDVLICNNPAYYAKRLPCEITTESGVYMTMIVDGSNVKYKDINV